MESIDELIPLTPEDLKRLEVDKTTSNLGCAIFPLLVFFVAMGIALYLLSLSIWLFFIAAAAALLCLIVSASIFWLGPSENKEVMLDITEGKKRRIIAPVESKEIVEIAPKTSNFSYGHVPSASTRLIRDLKKSSAPLDLKYSMRVKEFNFPLTEEQYLTRFRKGNLVEFYVAPHSKMILSEVIEIGEQIK